MKRLSVLLMLLTGLQWSACKGQPTGLVKDVSYDKMLAGMLDSTQVPFISVDQLSKNPDQYLILDARAREEFEVSHIPGAIWIGYDEYQRDRIQNLSEDKPVVVYCSVGYRSEKIGRKLQEHFSSVYNLYGSIFEWANQSRPLVNEGDTTQSLHTYNKRWSKWVTNTKIQKQY